MKREHKTDGTPCWCNPRIEKMNDIKEKCGENKNRILFIGKDNWPVEGIIGRPIITFLRRLIHTRRIVRYKTWRKNDGCKINFNK